MVLLENKNVDSYKYLWVSRLSVKQTADHNPLTPQLITDNFQSADSQLSPTSCCAGHSK